MEMSTARALMSYEEIHQPSAEDHPDEEPSNEEDISGNEEHQPEIRVKETPQLRMRLRSRNKVN